MSRTSNEGTRGESPSSEQLEQHWLDALKREELLRAEVTRLQGLEQRNQITLQAYLERAELAEAEVLKLKAMVETLDARLLDAEAERAEHP